jgi:hypothetical protein
MKKLIVLGLVVVLLAGLAVSNVSANFWGSIKAEMVNGTIVIGNGGHAEVIGSDGQEKTVDIGRGTMDIYFPEPTPLPHRYQHWYECAVPL